VSRATTIALGQPCATSVPKVDFEAESFFGTGAGDETLFRFTLFLLNRLTMGFVFQDIAAELLIPSKERQESESSDDSDQ